MQLVFFGGVSMGQRVLTRDKGRFGRILVADDDPVCLKLLSTMINTLGFAVDQAITGEEAWRAASKGDYFAVLMDCQMPVLDGFQATTVIRSLSDAKALVPIVGISAGESQADLDRCQASGMNDYLAKPVRLEKLKLLLHNLLRRETSFDEVTRTSGSRFSAVDDSCSDATLDVSESRVLDENVYQGLVNLGHDVGTDLVGELIRTFVETAPACIEDMEHAVNVSDAFLLARSAHRLRGSAWNLGAARLAAVCLDIDHAAHQGNFQSAHEQFDRLRLSWAEVIAALRERVGRDKSLREVLEVNLTEPN